MKLTICLLFGTAAGAFWGLLANALNATQTTSFVVTVGTGAIVAGMMSLVVYIERDDD